MPPPRLHEVVMENFDDLVKDIREVALLFTMPPHFTFSSQASFQHSFKALVSVLSAAFFAFLFTWIHFWFDKIEG